MSLVSYNIESYHFKQDEQEVKRNNALFVDHELYQDVLQPISTDWIRKTDLQLVCYEVLG